MSERFIPRHHVLYPNLYLWYILASSIDIMLTYVIIYGLGGREVNGVANNLLHQFGHWGLIGLKYATVVLVVAICEIVGRRNLAFGRKLAVAAIVISAFPVGAGLVQVFAWTHLFTEPHEAADAVGLLTAR
jgi:hypothetical protein